MTVVGATRTYLAEDSVDTAESVFHRCDLWRGHGRRSGRVVGRIVVTRMRRHFADAEEQGGMQRVSRRGVEEVREVVEMTERPCALCMIATKCVRTNQE